MAPLAPPGDDFAVLNISMPAVPSFSTASCTHEVRVRRNTPKVPTKTDSRSLFLKNVPVDSTVAHFRAVFTHLVGVGRFESMTFGDEKQAPWEVAPAQAVKISGYGKKRKRAEQTADEPEEEVARLPGIWTRQLRKSGGTAVVLLADEKSVRLVLKAIEKTKRTKNYPVWGEGVTNGSSPLGVGWVSSHLQLCRSDKTATQSAVHNFFNVFNKKEKDATELAKRLRNEPDEDGFITVTRGARRAPASRSEAEAARQRMLEKQAKKKTETTGFYRFQLREKRKSEQTELLKRFQDDQRRVNAMKDKRGKFRPEK
jgi:ribosomal RNA-processing protein 7